MKKSSKKILNVVKVIALSLFLLSYASANEKPSFPTSGEKVKPETHVEKTKPAQPKAGQQKDTKKDTPPAEPLKREFPPLPHSFDKGENTESLKSYKPQTQVIKDEGLQTLDISLKDVSRLVCFTDIEKVIYSREKGIEIKTSGRNAYIKNLPKESVNPITGRLMVEYDSRPKELYVICGEKTFSLILIPQDIPAVTAYLQSSHADTMKALAHEKSSTYEDTILSLIKSAYFEEIPPGYEVSEINKPEKEFKELLIVHSKDYTGTMYQVQEYVLIAKAEITIDEMTILNTLKPVNPLAVSIVSMYLRNGEQSRVFIVRRQK